MNVRFFILLVVAVCAVSAPRSANAFDPRLWVDDSTTFSVEGTIDPERSFADGSDSVFIVDAMGRTFECKLSRLYETAREYVELARNAYKSNDPKQLDALDWELDSARNAGVRRVVNVDGVDYAFRWIQPGKYSEPNEEFDPNLARAVAATRSQSRSKKAAPQKSVKTGFWMLETEVTLEMFNQFVTETKYKPGMAASAAANGNNASVAKANGAKSDDPYASFDDNNKSKPAKPAPGKIKSSKIGYSSTPQKLAGLRRGDEFNWKNPGFAQTKKNPVTLVSHDDANAFCAWLTRKLGKNVSLPSTSQWRLASQPERLSLGYASLFELWAFGGTETWERGNLPDANFPVICPTHVYLLDRIHFVYRDSYRFTVPVGSFKPNSNGLYDMIGNVGEMTSDDPNVVESYGGSWFHLPGFNPICWVHVDDLGYESLDRAIRDYQTSRTAPSFAAQVAQEPYYENEYGLPTPEMYDDPLTGSSGMGGQRVQGNPFAQDNSVKPFIHIAILDVDATCFTGFRVIIQ